MGLAKIAPIKQPGQKVEDVSKLVADITAKDSEIMQRAGARGLQVANSRGLMNGTMGVQASQAAVLDQAIPMASQNASQNYGSNASKQQTDQQMDLNKQGLEVDKAKIVAQTDAQSQLAQEAGEIQMKQQVQGQNFTAEQADLNRSVEIKKSADTMTANIFSDYQAQEASIMNNPNIPASERTQLLANAKGLSEARVRAVNVIYETDFDWPVSFLGGRAPAMGSIGAAPYIATQ